MKAFPRSLTIVGILMLFAMWLVERYKLNIAPEEMQTTIEAIVAVGSFVLAIYGRWRKGDLKLPGVGSDTPGNITKLLIAGTVLLVLAGSGGCGATPRERYAQVNTSVTQTIRILNAFRQAEKIGDHQWYEIVGWIDKANFAMRGYRAALDGGGSDKEIAFYIKAIDEALRHLLEAQAAVEAREQISKRTFPETSGGRLDGPGIVWAGTESRHRGVGAGASLLQAA